MPTVASALPSPFVTTARNGLLGDPAFATLKDRDAKIQLERGAMLYREGDPAEGLYEVVAGGVKNLVRTSNGGTIVVGFRFAGDVCGFAPGGRHIESAEAMSAVLAYKIPSAGLERALDATAVQRQVIARACDDLDDRQQQIALLSRKDALGRLALFVAMMERRFGGRDGVRMPMRRSDVASYLSLTQEAVSRGFRALIERGILRFRTKRQFTVIDRAGLRALTTHKGRGAPPSCNRKLPSRLWGKASTTPTE